jgi:hypothetical protein
MFKQEITQAIDQVLKQMQEAAQQTPAPNPEMLKFEFEKQVKESELKLKEYQILSTERIETARIQLEQQMAQLKGQMESYTVQSDEANRNADRAIQYEKIRNDIAVSQAQIAQRQGELQLEAQRLTDQRAANEYDAQASERLAMFDFELKQAAQQLEQYRIQIDAEERWATENRLQREAQLNEMLTNVELVQRQNKAQTEALAVAAKAKIASQILGS